MTSTTEAFQIALLLSTILCSLVFGWVLLFTIVVMPGIAKLDDGGFLQAFKNIDGVIQHNEPVFVSVWIGSVLALLVTMGLATVEWSNVTARLGFMILSTIAWLACQVTTFGKNVPLNNHLQTLDIENLDAFSKKREREHFEGPWNFWNNLRTVVMGVVSLFLSVALLLEEPGF